MGTTRGSIVAHGLDKANTLISNLYTSVAKTCKQKGDTNVSSIQAKLSLQDSISSGAVHTKVSIMQAK